MESTQKPPQFFNKDLSINSFLENATDAIILINDQGLIVFGNRPALNLFGYESNDLLNNSVDILAPDLLKNTRTETASLRTFSGQKKDGTSIQLQIGQSKLKSNEEILDLFIIRELSDRQKEELKFRGFLESAPDAVVVINNKGDIVIVNSLAEKMFGYQHQELLGQKIEILVPDRYAKNHVHQRDGYFKELKTRPMGEGKPLMGKRKDGSEFPVEISLSPLVSEQETLVTSIIRDISPRLKLEAKFKGLLESAPDGIVVVDSEGKIAIVNSQTERLFDYKRDELIGKPIEILVPERYRKNHIDYRNTYISHPQTRPMGAGRRLTGRKKDGSEFPVEISLSPLRLDNEILVTSIIRDITERRQIEEHMQASLREKEALLKEIHHRVKNNLQVTSSLLRLQSNYIEDQKSRDLFSESQNRIKSMALVHEKLYQSKELSKINFPEYIESLSVLLFRAYGVDRDQIELEVKGREVFLSVETAVPCGLMINELVSNCLKHAFPKGRKGKITVSIKHDFNENHYSLEVSDNGIGLPPELDIEKTDSLGLQLVRTLTSQLNGKFQARSAHPGTIIEIDFSELKVVDHEQN